MALVDALLEIGRQWDEIENRIGERRAAQGREILAANGGDAADTQANRFLEMLASRLPDDSSVFAALERHSDRGSGPDDSTSYILIEDLGWHTRPQMARVNSIEQFALRVLRDRLVTSRSPVRRAARHDTLQRLTSGHQNEGWVGLAVALQQPVPGLGRQKPLWYRGRETLAFNPVEAFLQLPPVMQTTAIASVAVRSPTSLVPRFQFDDRLMSKIAEETNQILGSWRDPWGTGSWWTRMNGRLRAIPLDLLGTDREAEIPAAAEALKSESF